MKIYIANFTPKINENTLLKLEKLYNKVKNYKDIYSQDGIFRIENNIIYKLIPEDYPIENFEYNNINFLLDKSKHIFRKDIYCIPYNHIVYNIQQIEYKFDSKSKISLILEYSGECLNPTANGGVGVSPTDIYFYTNEENLCQNYKNNICEYFSLLNNIKQY